MATTMATVPSSPSPQPTRARRASYRVLMNRLCSIAGLLAVVAEEDVLQVHLRAGQGEQPVAGGRLDQGVDLPLDNAGHHRPLDPQVVHPGQRTEVGRGHWAGEAQFQVASGPGLEGVDVLDRDQAAVADDGGP